MAQFVIVGMGAAALSAAETIRHHHPEAPIVMITDDPHGYYSRPGLAYVLNHEIPEGQVFPLGPERWRGLAVQRVLGRAVQLDLRARQVIMDTGHRFAYDRLLLATGAAAVRLDIPGADLEGVVALDSLADTKLIVRAARRARHAVIVGGGVTALELVEGLRARRVHVHYVMRGDRYWRSVLDETESAIIEQRLSKEGVAIHHHTEIARILGARRWRGRQRVAGVETKDGRQLRCQVVGVAIGVRPRLELVAGTAVEVERGILVDDRLETSVRGVYAAGDVAQVCDPLTGRAQLDILWPIAVEQGRVAGANMAGLHATYDRGVPFNVTRLAGLVVSLIGAIGTREQPDADLVTISRGDSEVWRGIPDTIVVHDRHDVNRQRLIIHGTRLVGAVIVGDQSAFQTVYRLIQERVDIGAHLAALRSPHVDLAQVLRQIGGLL